MDRLNVWDQVAGGTIMLERDKVTKAYIMWLDEQDFKVILSNGTVARWPFFEIMSIASHVLKATKGLKGEYKL